MAKNIVRNNGGCPLHWVDNSAGQPRHLFQAAILYLTVLAVLWCIPTCLYHRISETGQAVVLTLVDTAAAELQSLAEPRINREFRSRSSAENSSLSGDNVRESEHLKETSQIPPPPTVDDTTEQPNNTDILGDEDALLLKKISEEVPEMVVIVRAEQNVNMDELELKTEENIDQAVSEGLPKVDDTFTTAPELNDTAAREQLVGGSRDETAAVILDGFVTSGPTDPHEDIPSFSEWAQKRLEEAEKKKTHPNVSVQTPGGPGRGMSNMKVRSKNYASPDCGAKIVAANPEARSARNILVSTRDEYMLNTCTSRVWFVVELCEAIQARKIELANFELFSSSPKDFAVYVTDRFPTRDWSPVGQFTAKDVKDIQSFGLNPRFFGKFIKIELQTHYGSEHFCPISLFRAYGTSEFEVLETETENQILEEASMDADDDEDSDEEEPLDSDGSDPPGNLFGSARDAVLSIVKKAAEVLVKSSDLTGNNITEIQHSMDADNVLEISYTSCITPRYTILCDNCSDQAFAKVFQLISCKSRQLDSWLEVELVNGTLRRGKLCGVHGVKVDLFARDGQEGSSGRTFDDVTRSDATQNSQANFVASVLKPEYIVALCNVLATKERKVVMNTSYEISPNSSYDAARIDVVSSKGTTDHGGDTALHRQEATSCTSGSDVPACKSESCRDARRRVQDVNEKVENSSTSWIESSVSTESLASQIKPTKTLGKEDLKKEPSIPILEPSKEPAEETLQAEMLTTVPSRSDLPTPTLKVIEDPPILGTLIETVSQTITSVPPLSLDSQEASDTLVSDIESAEIASVQGKAEKSENGEQEARYSKDLGDQEVKLTSQDHLTLDTLFSDLKDLEGDTANIPNGASSSSSITQPTSNIAPQKESVFLRLSNRIKTLERNMSLSGQYLEELSRRYKKQVEEMQRSLERAMSAMGEESRKDEEREAKRVEEIAVLREEIAVLSKSVETLLHDRDSWRSRISAIGQHALLICIEVIVIILVLSYCRRAGELDEEEKCQSSLGKQQRRKSAENFSSHAAKKQTKNRRPSEIASHIGSTYSNLLIEDRCNETKKERKRKRRKEAVTVGIKGVINVDAKREAIRYKDVLNAIPGGTTLPSRRASSIDPPRSKELQYSASKRPESAPETVTSWMDNKTEVTKASSQIVSENRDFGMDSEQNTVLGHQVDELNESNSSSVIVDGTIETSTPLDQKSEKSRNGPFRASGILKSAKLSSPSFMKTALGTRKKRKLSSSNEKYDWSQDSEHSNDRSSTASPTGWKNLSRTTGSVNGSATNGLIEESDESRSSSTTPSSDKKEKKGTGLKKMVRKLF